MSLLENRLFKRDVSLIAYPKLDAKDLPNPTVPVDALDIFTRIQFDIEKTSESNANNAKIRVFNLSQNSLSFLEQSNMTVFLRAGYVGDTPGIFFGEIKKKIPKDSKGPDRVIEFECVDHEDQIRNRHVEIGLGPGATALQILKQATDTLGLDVSTLEGIRDKVFPNGFSFSGSVKALIDFITEDQDAEWNIQDGQFQILPALEAKQEEAQLISPETGLLGTPSKDDEGFQFTTLLNARILPGRMVRLESKQFSQLISRTNATASAAVDNAGAFLKVKKVTHKGDSQEGDYKTTVEGIIPENLGILLGTGLFDDFSGVA